jgi:exonuclease III
VEEEQQVTHREPASSLGDPPPLNPKTNGVGFDEGAAEREHPVLNLVSWNVAGLLARTSAPGRKGEWEHSQIEHLLRLQQPHVLMLQETWVRDTGSRKRTLCPRSHREFTSSLPSKTTRTHRSRREEGEVTQTRGGVATWISETLHPNALAVQLPTPA